MKNAWIPIRLLALFATFSLLVCTSERTLAATAKRCAIVTSSGVSFGGYNSFTDIPLDSAGLIAYQCTGVGPSDMVTIQLSRGVGGSFVPRAMAGPSPRFEYNLFVDAACTTVWGDGTSGTAVYSGHPTEGTTISIPVYGRVLPRQLVRAGSYSDLIVVTILY